MRSAVPRPSARRSLAIVGVVALTLGGCGGDAADEAVAVGNADNGRELFVGYGCGACHQVSSVRGATGRVGPVLDDLHEQRMIAGVLPNTPEFVAAWIRNPREYDEDTGMPDVGVSEEDSLDIAAFLLEQG